MADLANRNKVDVHNAKDFSDKKNVTFDEDGNPIRNDTVIPTTNLKGLPIISLNSIQPSNGPTTGYTRVKVRGGPFKQYIDQYPHPKCKFGNLPNGLVSATYVTCTENYNVFTKEAKHNDRNYTCI